MSWIVQHLLRNKEIIKSVPDIDSDEYNNLLVVESKVNELYNEGFLSDIDISILNLVGDGRPIRNLESEIDKNRITISKTFVQICDRISYFLGGYFTDEGFLDIMKSNYRLSDNEVNRLKDYMSGKFKHKLMRKTNNEFTEID